MLERQEVLEGVIGIAGPIRDYSRKLVASLGIAVVAGKSQKKSDLDHCIDFVREAYSEKSSAPAYLKF